MLRPSYRMSYTLHYVRPPHVGGRGCGLVAQAIVEKYRAADGQAAAVADLDNATLWDPPAGLQWALACDRPITAQDARAHLGALEAAGALPALRRAVGRLVAALAAAYPRLQRAGRPVAAQLVALGRDIALEAGQDAGFLEFIEKEIQPVDLCALLKL
jgi:hypothetical protein